VLVITGSKKTGYSTMVAESNPSNKAILKNKGRETSRIFRKKGRISERKSMSLNQQIRAKYQRQICRYK
jgi:hypothetical protein